MAKSVRLVVVMFIATMLLVVVVVVATPKTETAFAVTPILVQNEFFAIIKPDTLAGNSFFATSETDEYLSASPLIFKLYPMSGQDYAEVKYTDGDSGGTLIATKKTDYFELFLRYNELYLFTITPTDSSLAPFSVEVDFRVDKQFDLTAPKLDFADTVYNSDGTATFKVVDTVSSKRHINYRSGIKSVTVTSAVGGLEFSETDYDYYTEMATFSVTLDKTHGDYTAIIYDHAGHCTTGTLVTWGDRTRENAVEMLSLAKTVAATTKNGVGLNDTLLGNINTYIDQLNELLNQDWATVNKTTVQNVVTKLGAAKQSANDAFALASSVDGILIMQIEHTQYLYGGSVTLSNGSALTQATVDGGKSTTDATYYYPEAKFGDEVVLTVSVNQQKFAEYAAAEGNAATLALGGANTDLVLTYVVKLFVNGIETQSANPFFVTISKISGYNQPVLVAATSDGTSLADCQSSDGWLRFEVTANGIYTAFVVKDFTPMPWWAWLLIAIGGVVIVSATVVAVVTIVKRKRSKNNTEECA